MDRQKTKLLLPKVPSQVQRLEFYCAGGLSSNTWTHTDIYVIIRFMNTFYELQICFKQFTCNEIYDVHNAWRQSALGYEFLVSIVFTSKGWEMYIS